MSDQKPKRPAHEVLLSRLDDCVGDVERYGNRHEDMGGVYILCKVLGEMVIPADCRKEVIARLHALRERCEVAERRHDIPCGRERGGISDLLYRLNEEDKANEKREG